VWSPGSDGLLVPGRARYRRTSAAEFVPLHGARIGISRFADAPIFLQWSGDTITFVRHDRLWKAAFDTSGLRSDPVPIGNDPALYLSASRDGTLLFVSEGGLRARKPDGTVVKLGWPVKYTPPVADPLLIRNVRIIDGTGATPSGPSDVLIERGRIAKIAAPGSLDSVAHTVDGSGRIMIPGLMDLHAHFYRPALLPAFAYFGVTTVRDQGSSMAPLVAYADLVAAGLLPGPRVSYGGFQFYSDWPFDEEQGRGIEPEADTGHVARSIALAAAFGAQHVKTRTFRRWDINARMIEAAHRLGMRATGHCSHEPPLIVAGMDAKEHIGICAPRVNGDIYDDVIQLFKSAGISVVPTISYLQLAVRLNEKPDALDADTSLGPFLPSREDVGWMIDLSPAARADWARDAGPVPCDDPQVAACGGDGRPGHRHLAAPHGGAHGAGGNGGGRTHPARSAARGHGLSREDPRRRERVRNDQAGNAGRPRDSRCGSDDRHPQHAEDCLCDTGRSDRRSRSNP
jgi:hypothetical protein